VALPPVRAPAKLRGDQSLIPLHHRFLAGAYYGLRIARAIARPLGVASPNQLRVLIYHDIAPQNLAGFAAQLRWLARSWNFVSAAQFAGLVSGEEPIRGRHLLLTFDDGLASNRLVAEAVLNPLGIRALFFVIADFVALEDRDAARRFIATHIIPGGSAEHMPAHWTNMGWKDLAALLEQGHAVGAHTATHARLSQVAAESDLTTEIVASADTLSHRLGGPIDHFAYTFGDLASFSERALAIARRRFRFVYSGLRGDNSGGVSPYALRRDAASTLSSTPHYEPFSNDLLGAFLEGGADLNYSGSRARLDGWCRFRH
jgi:peptidoglycan/xylan/chitin deacetylase (PgdA/CDA1 family)